MRHRSQNRDTQRRDKNQLQNQVLQLKRVIRIQNQVIVALSSCFAIVIMSTLLLIQHLPHPNDERGLIGNVELGRSRDKELKRQLKQHDETPQHPVPIPLKCPHYGCPIQPVEMAFLRNTSHSFIASPNHILITHKSNRQKPAPVNQDRAILIPSFGNDRDANMKINPHGNFFMGIFDGHDDNGHHIAQFASEEIPSRIASKLRDMSLSTEVDSSNHTTRQIEQIVTQTFVEVDKDAPMPGGGCTASIVFRRGYDLYMANTGDSTSFILVYRPPSNLDKEQAGRNEKYIFSPRTPDRQLHLQGSVTIHHQNEKHKAHFPREQSRIESLGGRIHIPPKNPMGSRVIVRSSLHREDVGLAMSRSIGDWEWTAIGVIPDPDVAVVDLRQFWLENEIESGAKVVSVVGSDGLFDARRVEFVANHLAFGLFEAHLTTEEHRQNSEQTLTSYLIEVGKKLISMASPLKEDWYRDDITFIAQVVDLGLPTEIKLV